MIKSNIVASFILLYYLSTACAQDTDIGDLKEIDINRMLGAWIYQPLSEADYTTTESYSWGEGSYISNATIVIDRLIYYEQPGKLFITSGGSGAFFIKKIRKVNCNQFILLLSRSEQFSPNWWKESGEILISIIDNSTICVIDRDFPIFGFPEGIGTMYKISSPDVMLIPK